MEPSADTLGKTGSAVEHDLLTMLPELARRIRSRADHSARRHRMTWAQLMIVRQVERQPGLSQNELAAIVGVAPITIARLIDRIEALGLVRRHEGPSHLASTGDAGRNFRASRQRALPSRSG
jgi:DNA-binding MarR family transcriptional regulator